LVQHQAAKDLATQKQRKTTLPQVNLIDAPPTDAALVKACVARALIGALQARCKAYCLLSGHERLPESFDTDIDFMVSREDFKQLPRIVEDVARQTGTQFFQAVDHELTGRAYFLASLAGSSLTIVQPDAASDYRHFGALWLRADEVLAGRRQNSRGLWIPSPAHEFAYYLIKRLNKRSLTEEHGHKLHRLYQQDSLGCDRMIGRYWSGRGRDALRRMAVCDDWAEMSARIGDFRAEMKHKPAESPAGRLASMPGRALHFMDRVTRPTGGWIAFMGPDGSGKSLAIQAMSRQLAPAFRSVERFHLRPKVLRGNASSSTAPVTDPHGQRPRGLLASVAKVFFLAADYWLGYACKIAPAMRRSRLVLFDRYVYDLLVDSKRVRYGGPRWLLRLAARVAPRPDLVILLDAPAEVLWKRKQEVPFDEIVRQRAAYLEVARKLPSAVVINAAQPSAAVIHDCAAAILAHFARRTAARLGLQPAAPAGNAIGSETPDYPC